MTEQTIREGGREGGGEASVRKRLQKEERRRTKFQLVLWRFTKAQQDNKNVWVFFFFFCRSFLHTRHEKASRPDCRWLNWTDGVQLFSLFEGWEWASPAGTVMEESSCLSPSGLPSTLKSPFNNHAKQ